MLTSLPVSIGAQGYMSPYHILYHVNAIYRLIFHLQTLLASFASLWHQNHRVPPIAYQHQS